MQMKKPPLSYHKCGFVFRPAMNEHGPESTMECQYVSVWRKGREAEFFWLSGVALVLVGGVGLVGNVLTLLVFIKSHLRKKPFFKLLITLALYDLLFIVSYGTILGYRALACHPNSYVNGMIYKITYPLLNIGLTGSIYATIAVSLERFLGICHPGLAVRKKSRFYILPLIFFSLAFNFPRFFEASETVLSANVFANVTKQDQLRHHTHSHHHVSESYKTGYYLWASVVFLSIIPNLLLLFLNGSIIKVICSNSARLHNVNGSLSSKDPKATKILFCIVGVFFVCHTQRIIYKCFYYLDFEDRS